MTFDRITKPLTALALCGLLATATIALPPVAWAQDTAQTAAAEETTDEETVAAEEPGEETAEDNEMPPMATAESVPVEVPPPNASVISPSMGQLQATDMNKVGRRQAATIQPGNTTPTPYVEPVGDTHPTLYLTPDKSVIVRLERPAASILVGNEAHVNVLIDTPTTLVAVPRLSGASYFTVLDADSRIIMKRHVVVGPAPQYVRIRRSCDRATGPCEDTSVFYCPEGMCHPVNTMQVPGTAPQQAAAPGGGASPGSMGDSANYAPEGTESGNGTEFPSFPYIPFPFNFPATPAEE